MLWGVSWFPTWPSCDQEVVTSALWECGSGAPRRRVLREAKKTNKTQDGDAVECRFQTVAAALRPCCWPALQHNQLTPALESHQGTDYQLARTVPLRK